MKHKGYNDAPSAFANIALKKKFAGEEFEDELGKNTVDFQLRDYDPAIARFNKTDRFAEKYRPETPYHFTLNNPILLREVQGDSVWVYNESIGKLGYAATHAFLRVKTDKVDVTIELTGQIEGAKTGRPTKKEFSEKWFKNGRGPVSDAFLVTPKGDNKNYKFENSILELFEIFTKQDEDGVYVNLPDYDATGPNSNGFVVSLVKNAYGGVELNLGIRGFGEGDTEDYDKAIYNYLLKGVQDMKDRNNSKPTIPAREYPGSAGAADDQKRKSKQEDDEK